MQYKLEKNFELKIGIKMKYVAFFALLVSVGCSSQKKLTDSVPMPTTKAVGNSTQVPTPTAVIKMDSEKHKLVCIKGNDKRELEVVKKKKGCSLDYTKLGKMTVVSSSKFSMKHCEDSQAKISHKLEKSGFQCNF